MPTDYTELAEQARNQGPVDYEALAEQARSSGGGRGGNPPKQPVEGRPGFLRTMWDNSLLNLSRSIPAAMETLKRGGDLSQAGEGLANITPEEWASHDARVKSASKTGRNTKPEQFIGPPVDSSPQDEASWGEIAGTMASIPANAAIAGAIGSVIGYGVKSARKATATSAAKRGMATAEDMAQAKRKEAFDRVLAGYQNAAKREATAPMPAPDNRPLVLVPVKPGPVREAAANVRERLSGMTRQPEPEAPPVGPVELPSGRVPGGIHNIPPPPEPKPPRLPPGWVDFKREPPSVAETSPIASDLPSGRKPGGPHNIPPEPEPVPLTPHQKAVIEGMAAKKEVPVDQVPVELPPLPPPDLPSGRKVGGPHNIKPSKPKPPAMKGGPSKEPPPPATVAAPPSGPTAKTEAVPGTTETTYQSGKHDSLLDHDVNAINKRNNIVAYIREHGGLTPAQLDKMGDADFRTIADAALEWGRKKGNPVPKGKYRTASTTSDTWGKIKRDLHPNVYDPAGLNEHIPETPKP